MKRLDIESWAAVAEAKGGGLKVTVHVGTDGDARAAIEAGRTASEHAAAASNDTVAMMAAKRVTFTPTLAVWPPCFEWAQSP